jgi:hypothetical protein
LLEGRAGRYYIRAPLACHRKLWPVACGAFLLPALDGGYPCCTARKASKLYDLGRAAWWASTTLFLMVYPVLYIVDAGEDPDVSAAGAAVPAPLSA